MPRLKIIGAFPLPVVVVFMGLHPLHFLLLRLLLHHLLQALLPPHSLKGRRSFLLKNEKIHLLVPLQSKSKFHLPHLLLHLSFNLSGAYPGLTLQANLVPSEHSDPLFPEDGGRFLKPIIKYAAFKNLNIERKTSFLIWQNINR